MSQMNRTLTQEDMELLKSAYIPEDQWELCYISPERIIFTPLYGDDNQMIKDGKTVYDEWLYNKEHPVDPPKSTDEKLAEVTLQLAKSQAENVKQKQQISELILNSAAKDAELAENKKQLAALTLQAAKMQSQINELITPPQQ